LTYGSEIDSKSRETQTRPVKVGIQKTLENEKVDRWQRGGNKDNMDRLMHGNGSNQALVGRDSELATLKKHLADTVSGKGSTVLISGEPGIGKTALVEAFKEYAATQNVKILSGAASADSAQPFLVFSKALAGEMDAPLFEEQEYKQFVKIFAINHEGMLVAQASSGEKEMDADIFAGMLSAVQDFVGDSFDVAGKQKTGLGCLEYSDMKILIERGHHLSLTGVFSGNEHPDMKSSLERTLQKIEEEHGAALEKWSEDASEVEHVRGKIANLTEAKFLVRRDLEGVKLENERIRIADGVLEYLDRLSDNRPLVLFLEDMHWADKSSLFVLRFLANNLGSMRTMIFATMRPYGDTGAQDSLTAMRDEKALTEFELSGLGMEDMRELADKTFHPNDFSPDFFERLHSDCAGNPFFLMELLRQMQYDGAITYENGVFHMAADNYSMPPSIEDIVQRRLDSLKPETLALAEYASCIGKDFVLSAVFSMPGMDTKEHLLESLNDTGIINITKKKERSATPYSKMPCITAYRRGGYALITKTLASSMKWNTMADWNQQHLNSQGTSFWGTNTRNVSDIQ